MVPRTTLILTASLLLCRASQGAEPRGWPQFGGSNSSGVADDGGPLPVDFNPSKNCLWKTPLPIGHSSPCVWGERIFLTGFDPAAPKLETLCINRRTGEVMWRRTAPAEKIEKG